MYAPSPRSLIIPRKQPLNALPVEPVSLVARGLDFGEDDEFDSVVDALLLSTGSLAVHGFPTALVNQQIAPAKARLRYIALQARLEPAPAKAR